MNERNLRVLEFPKIRERMAAFAVSEMGRERALELATYNADDGWCLEWGHEKDEIKVHWWMALPEDERWGI